VTGVHFAFLRDVAVHFSSIIDDAGPLCFLLGLMVPGDLYDSSFAQGQQARVPHVGHPAAVPSNQAYEGTGAALASNPRIFAKFFLE
jgi:hypothetical protein